MKYCENGHSNRDDAKFCGTCGKPIVQKSADFTLTKYPDIKFEVTDYKEYRKFPPGAIVFGFILGFFPRYIMLLAQMVLGGLKGNSDFMESTNSLSGYKRIAKNGKLGLFDTNNRYVRLPAAFDKIVLFDSHHYLIQIEEKYGIYSTVFHKIIVPPKYESISLRSEGVWCAMDKGNVVYYSCNGKDVR